ncbi:hypothetical protein AWC38_SpisGene19748 [Stylophora pistillata]|uniref:Uncharacterized protein n=1 Tax=Stylophora pistillata TaxID=50429 RepID=A0A2B4RGR8_STYPI|nr:hypothetical protein AWC38_SpisGene19748 [Stylophora pistillata]
MGDRSKIKTGNLRANVMEEKELSKRLNRLKRQTDYFVSEIEAEQVVFAKKFLSHLNRSRRIAEAQESVVNTFKSTRWNFAFENQRSDQTIRSKRLNSKESTSLEMLSGSVPEERAEKKPSRVLKRISQQFEVPYKKLYSFKTSEFGRPATVLDMRCKMWQRISYCADKKDRVKSAPPWAENYKAPRQIEQAHYRALDYIGMKKNLVSPPSRQPQIDIAALRSYRGREVKVERRVVSQFNDSLEPFKIKPGAKQIIYDANGLYD